MPPALSPRAPSGVERPPSASPFLKWAGGKRQLLPRLRQFVPAEFGGYYEPFMGSAAVFFDLYNQGRLDARSATLGDCNADLVGCYAQVRDRVEDVIRELRKLEKAHQRDASAHYYRVRDEQFNPTRLSAIAGADGLASRYTPQLAAMLIYLNRTGFNGLFRLNGKHAFNVPIGRYVNPLICDADNLRAVSIALRRLDVCVVEGTFADNVAGAQRGDLVYFDPPYAPLSRTADFTSYTSTGFDSDDQRALQALVLDLANRGVYVVLSNSTAQEIADLYRDNIAAHKAGLKAYTVPARRAINSRPGARGEVLEFVITNVPSN
jgi:DNA adenine methylase